MERDNDTTELVELGSVSAETQGVDGLFSDGVIAIKQTGLSDD